MAFNPFHSFRRYSKVVFAILAIICMFTFVLSSGTMGRGDFFTDITDWITNRRRTPALMTLYGKELDGQKVYQVQQRRRLASEYMDRAVETAQMNLNNRVVQGLSKLDQNPSVRRQVEEILTSRYVYLNPNQPDFYLQNILPRQWQMLSFFHSMAEQNKDKNPDELATLTALRGLLSLDFTRFAGRRAGDLYFGGSLRAGEALNDTRDFLIWLHVADEFGIKLADDDISNAIVGDTLNEMTGRDAAAIDKYLRDQFKTGYNKDVLFSALGDELRARMAQVALTGTTLTGSTRTHTAIPVFPTPEELWELYKDARTTVKAGVIDLPVESFVSQVTATPTDKDLQALFDKYKNDEVAPERAEPGFKEPRRVQVEWVGTAADSAFYRKAGDQLSQILPGLRMLGFMEAASTLSVPLAADAELLYEEQDYRRRELPWTNNLTPGIHATSYWRPENIATLVGAAVGAPGTDGVALTGLVALEGQAFVREVRDRTELGGAMILSAALEPTPVGFLGLPTEATPRVNLPLIRGVLTDKAKNLLVNGSPYVTGGSGLIQSDLRTFRTEVTKKGNEAGSDRTAVRKYVDEFVKERGLEHGMTTEPRDQFNLLNDPGLTPLREQYQRDMGQQDVLLRGFPRDFFAETDLQTNTPIGLYAPQRFIPRAFGNTTDEKTFLFWRTEDVPSRTPTFAKARPEVVEAWKRQQARDLAKKAAEKLADLAKQTQGDAQKLRDLAVQQGNREYFELGPMARKNSAPSPQPGYGQQYQNATIPPERIPYAGDDLLQRVLGLRNDPKGTAVVVTDLPLKNFYVTTLLQREEPTQEEFHKVYTNWMTRATSRDDLLTELAYERRSRYRNEVLQQLRAEAKAAINEDAGKRSGETPTGD
jgi:hypothetical protein